MTAATLLAPKNASVDHSNKTYQRGPGFASLFPKDVTRCAADEAAMIHLHLLAALG